MNAIRMFFIHFDETDFFPVGRRNGIGKEKRGGRRLGREP